jgi:hypothetical protein
MNCSNQRPHDSTARKSTNAKAKPTASKAKTRNKRKAKPAVAKAKPKTKKKAKRKTSTTKRRPCLGGHGVSLLLPPGEKE